MRHDERSTPRVTAHRSHSCCCAEWDNVDGRLGAGALHRLETLRAPPSPTALHGEGGAGGVAIALAIDEDEADRTVLTSRRRAIVQISHLLGSYCHHRAPLR